MLDYELKISGGTALEVLAKTVAWGQLFSEESPKVRKLADKLLEAQKNIKGDISTNEQIRELAQAVEHLAIAVLGGHVYTAKLPTQTDASTVTEPDPAPVADPPGPAAGENGPSAAPSEKPAEAAAPKPTTGKAPSLEAIRAKGIEVAKKHGQAKVKAILKEFGAENMTTLPEDKRAAFLEKLERLGEGIA